MGLLDKLKSIISRKKDIVEEVKDEYDVEEVNDIEEDTIPEESEDKEIKKENYELPALGDEEPESEEDEEESEDEEEEEEPVEEVPRDEEDEESEEEDEEESEDESEDEEESDDEDEEDKEWLEFVKEQQNKNKVEEAKDIETYDKGLEKTRKEFVSKLSLLGVKYTKIDDEYYDELEELLINADVGVNTVMSFMDRLRDRVKKEKITDTAYLNEIIVDELFIIYVDNQSLSDKINMASEGPTVILMVGVNGVGKTTTIGKLAYKYKNEGKKVMLVAGDTFRAGAVKQLEEWADRTGCMFYGKEETDPAGVVFDGLVKAKEENVDIVLVDTAGRLQNKVNLMKELEKINKVIERHIPGAPHETLLVIDATTGQNGISQAIAFKEITNITGIVLTKLDGTAKGGIVLAIKEEVKIPVKFIGLGEKMTDLKAFDIENYIYGLFKDMM
ncbi:MAG: signal recognition particle-docking protein FtsY [Bacilli bacterium]|nr:signal recognition particle-docking protein FtsY [Bacilli bacterium]